MRHYGTFFRFDASSATATPHRFCAIRNCAGRAIAQLDPVPTISGQYRGINPGPGIGTFLEGNQIANLASGVFDTIPTVDLIIRNNYFRNIDKGIDLFAFDPYEKEKKEKRKEKGSEKKLPKC
jgi:hypothetical protein